VARKMGVPETEPVPASLAFLADEAVMEKSFDKYLASTDAYRAKLRQWKKERKLKPDLKKPLPSDVADDAFNNLIELDSFDQTDHLVVQLSLPSPPVHTNGRWDETLKQVVWDTAIADRTTTNHLPFSCYASWSQADEIFQREHLGKVALTGDELTQYCLWRSSLDMQRGGKWDAFLSGLQPGGGLVERLDAFRFPGEPAQVGTNVQQKISSPSDYPRELLKTALR
jgi:hypothetical protein